MNRTDWLNCKRCGLHKTRKKVVLGRGTLPAPLLFIGEAPGKTEDLLGEPFVGPAGKLLRRGIEAAADLSGVGVPPYYITNACACRPTDEKDGDNRQPTGEELWACFQRLEAEAKAAAPRVVVFLGKVPEKACRALFPAGVALQHPAYILRCGGIGCPAWTRFIRDLSVVLKGLNHAKVRRWGER